MKKYFINYVKSLFCLCVSLLMNTISYSISRTSMQFGVLFIRFSLTAS